MVASRTGRLRKSDAMKFRMSCLQHIILVVFVAFFVVVWAEQHYIDEQTKEKLNHDEVSKIF